MNRSEFETLRDLPGKVIPADIKFSKRTATAPALIADARIDNSAGMDLRLNIHYNPERGSTSFNVHVPGVGPICRLDIDGAKHGDAGRTHKHSLLTEKCPEQNLRTDVKAKPELSLKPLADTWAAFCAMSNLAHGGQLILPGGV